MTKPYRICVLPGDGIGREVVPAAVRVLEATGIAFEFDRAEAGWDAFEAHGSSVPEATLEAVGAADATLAGAFTSPNRAVPGFEGAIRVLRRHFDLFANLRPARSRPLKGCAEGIDMLMVRENTEGLYVRGERRYGDLAIADAVITKRASRRIAEVAFDAAARRRGHLVVIHKANVLTLTSGLFRETVLEAAKARNGLQVRELIVDAAAMRLVQAPQEFDVMVTTNLFGDILSDLMAGLVGGLGLAPSANVGEGAALFEPVHGSGPDIAGKGVANPTATILSAALMLEHLGERDAAERVDAAVNEVLGTGPWTPDMGGAAGTEAFADAVAARI